MVYGYEHILFIIYILCIYITRFCCYAYIIIGYTFNKYIYKY